MKNFHNFYTYIIDRVISLYSYYYFIQKNVINSYKCIFNDHDKSLKLDDLAITIYVIIITKPLNLYYYFYLIR